MAAVECQTWGGGLTVTDSDVSGNFAGAGGGILSYGTLTVSNATISNNSSPQGGGGMIVRGQVAITGSMITNNSASIATGGAIRILEDATVECASPSVWAEAAIDAMTRHGADRLVAEVNQGGDLVAEVVRQVDPFVPFHGVYASRGKSARAEPVSRAPGRRGRSAPTAGSPRPAGPLRGGKNRARGVARPPRAR